MNLSESEADDPIAAVVVEGVKIILRDRGEAADPATIAATLSDAAAFLIFSSIKDPSDTDAVRTIAERMVAATVETVALMVGQVERAAL